MTHRPDCEKPTLAALARIAALTLFAAGVLLTAVIVWRWLAGALDRPMPPAALLLAAIVIAATAATVRRLYCFAAGGNTPIGRQACCDFSISAIVVLLAVSLTSHVSQTSVAIAFWVIALLGEASALKRNLVACSKLFQSPNEDSPTTADNDQATSCDVPSLAVEQAQEETEAPTAISYDDRFAEVDVDIETDEETDFELAADETQRIVRKRLSGDDEVIYGTVRVTIESGRRLHTTHLTFTPPFARPPVTWDVEPTTGPDATISFSRIEPIGARLEIKLDRPAETDSDLLFIFSVSTTDDQS